MPKLSIQNSPQWICRRCEKQHPEVKAEHSTELLKTCGLCGVENWCFPVMSGRPVKGAKADTNTTDMAPEAELPKETEAVEEPPTEAVGPILAEAIELEKEPDKTELEAEPEPSANDAEIAELEAKLAKLKPTK